MAHFITLEEILHDNEIYEYLKFRYGHRVPPPPSAKSALVMMTDDLNTFMEEMDAIAAMKPSKPATAAKSSSASSTSSVTRGRSSFSKRQNRIAENCDPKPPPIFITSARKWSSILDWCFERQIKFQYVRRTSRGIKVIADTLEDYNGLVKLLVHKSITFQTQTEQRIFHAALHFVPKNITDQQIKEALLAEDIPVQEVNRMECEVSALRETHVMIVVTVLRGAAGRRIFKINPIELLLRKQDEVANEDGSDYESGPSCELSNYPCPSVNNKQEEVYNDLTDPYSYITYEVIVNYNEHGYTGENPVTPAYSSSTSMSSSSSSHDSRGPNLVCETESVSHSFSRVVGRRPLHSPQSNSLAADLDLIGHLTRAIDSADRLQLLDWIRENERNPEALMSFGWNYSDLIEEQASFSVFPDGY